MKMEQTECSETSAHKIQTPGKYPEESIQQSYPFFARSVTIIISRSTLLQESKMGPIGCLEMSASNHHSTLCEIPKDGRSQLSNGESLKPHTFVLCLSSTSNSPPSGNSPHYNSISSSCFHNPRHLWYFFPNNRYIRKAVNVTEQNFHVTTAF
jgi:hypothetical protein